MTNARVDGFRLAKHGRPPVGLSKTFLDRLETSPTFGLCKPPEVTSHVPPRAKGGPESLAR